MKTFLCLFLTIAFLLSCSKDHNTVGNLSISLTYQCALQQKSARVNPIHVPVGAQHVEGQYTQFGDYITSITPTVFIAKFLDMRIQNWTADGTAWNKSINIIDNNTDIARPDRLADFSNNAKVDFIPVLQGYDTSDPANFNVYVFMICFFYQEFELPAAYDTVVDLDHLDYACQATGEISFNDFMVGGTRTGRFVKVGDVPFLKDILYKDIPHAYVFGATDSTFMYASDGHACINDPLGQGGNIIRSNAYQPITIPAVTPGETKTIYGTMTFDTNNIIQVYAGADNKPYTPDDIFVYAPRYWERLSISVNAEK